MKELIENLDKWIDESDKQAERFEKSGMEYGMLTSQAMATAYRNVKQYIEENYKEQ